MGKVFFMKQETVTYLDNAASTWPKPPNVVSAIERVLREDAANPGRSGHRLSVEAARIIAETRASAAQLLGAADPLRIVFTKNATESLNIVIQGLLRPGDHVITSSMEHNSVMRPLRWAEKNGVALSVVPCLPTGELDPDDVRRAIRPDTRLIVMSHASNVTGTILPVAQVGSIAREHGIPLCVDAAQAAGCLDIDVVKAHIDLLAFTGHKSLYGPQGTGGLYMVPGLEDKIRPLIMGGTGSASEREEQPAFMPDRYESGTPNTPGIAGLLHGLRFIEALGVMAVREKEMGLASKLRMGLSSIPGVLMYGPGDQEKSIAVVSFNIEGMDPAQVAFRLDDEFDIMTRSGLHCAPSAHRSIGTFPGGTVRMSLGCFNTTDQVDRAVHAVSLIAGQRR